MSSDTRLAIVTGTSRGLGTAIAAALLQAGWDVVGIARGAAPGELEHPCYEHTRLDLSDAQATADWFEGAFRSAHGARKLARFALVNNAGTLAPMKPIAALGQSDAGAIARALTLNAGTPLWLMGGALRFAAGVPLRIINVSSGAAASPYPGWAAYCAGKAALEMTGAVLEQELAEVPQLDGRDVAVVSYAPHVVATAMQAEIRAMDVAEFPRQARFVGLEEEGALVAPAEPAAEIAALASADGLPRFSKQRFVPK